MGRRTRKKWVKKTPHNFYFLKVAEQGSKVDKFIILTVSEFEAMRLKHYINLNQNEAAKTMGVSQPTFSRILESAHLKITQALIEGKKVRVYGGNIGYKSGFKGYGCLDCNYEWEDKKASSDRKINCPKCNGKRTHLLIKEPI